MSTPHAQIPVPYTPEPVTKLTGAYFFIKMPKHPTVMCGKILEVTGNYAFIAEFDFEPHPGALASGDPNFSEWTRATRDVSEYSLIPLEKFCENTSGFFSTWDEMMVTSTEVERLLLLHAVNQSLKQQNSTK